MKRQDASRLQDEYKRLVQGLRQAGQPFGLEKWMKLDELGLNRAVLGPEPSVFWRFWGEFDRIREFRARS